MLMGQVRQRFPVVGHPAGRTPPPEPVVAQGRFARAARQVERGPQKDSRYAGSYQGRTSKVSNFRLAIDSPVEARPLRRLEGRPRHPLYPYIDTACTLGRATGRGRWVSGLIGNLIVGVAPVRTGTGATR